MLDDFEVDTPCRLRKKGKRRAKISLGDKVEIVHQVLVEHQKMADVAKEFRI